MNGLDCVVLTYDVPHRKTYDTLCLLKASGYTNVLVWAVPMHYRKTFYPIYEHRPSANRKIATKEVCRNFGYQYVLNDSYSDLAIDSSVPVLVCGAGLIPDEIKDRLMLINAHPGYIPFARGLDALKWAIYEDLPIGVTTHFIGDEIDAGWVIERREIPLYDNDTFHALTQRVYENEVEMLVEAIKKPKEDLIFIPAGNHILHKRMSSGMEMHLMEKFEVLVRTRGIPKYRGIQE